MNVMTECSCAIVLVDGITFLCLPQGRPFFAPAAPCPRAERFGLPFSEAQVLHVLQGGAEDDFCWLIVTNGGSTQREPEPQAAVAAAITARLFGLSVGAGPLLGKSLASGVSQMCHPPGGEWWHGIWGADALTKEHAEGKDDRRISPADDRYNAALLMHGEVVLYDCAASNPDRRLDPGLAPSGKN